MNRSTIIVLSFLLLVGCRHHDQSGYYIDGIADPVIDLNGTWKVNINPPETFRDLEILDDSWKDIQVPGECMMQGFAIKHDKPFVYKKSISIPEDFNGKSIIMDRHFRDSPLEANMPVIIQADLPGGTMISHHLSNPEKLPC